MEKEVEEEEVECSQTYEWKEKSNKCESQCTVQLGCWCWGKEVDGEDGEDDASTGQDGQQVAIKDVGAESMDALWSEFKWENMWFQQVPNCKEKDFRGWKNIGATFGIALSFGLLLSIFDVSSDFLTFWLFLNGDNYRKTVPSEDNHYVTGSFNCTKIGHFYNYRERNITSFSFECRESNPVFAWFTLAFVLLPAPNLCLALVSKGPSWIFLAFLALIVPFPVTVLLVKSIALFNIGKEFKLINQMVTEAEARWESSLQFCLQLFIVFTRGDRQPSLPQLFSIAMSVVMMSKGSIGNFVADDDPQPLGHRIVKIGTMFPVHLTNLVFKLGSLSIICALLSLNAVWLYLLVGLVCLFLWLPPGTQHLTKSAGGHVVGLPNTATPDVNFVACARRELCDRCSKNNLRVWNLVWLFINSTILISLTITANIWPDFPIPIFFPFHDSTLKETFPQQMLQLSAFRGVSSDGGRLRLADLPIVEDIYILNTAVAVILTCGVVSAFLIHWQLILEYEGLKESSRWTGKEQKTVETGTNTDSGRAWWKLSSYSQK